MSGLEEKKKKGKLSIEITGSNRFTGLKVIYGKAKNVPGFLTIDDHGMCYIVSATFRTTDGKLYFGFPEVGGRIEFTNHTLTGDFVVYGKG